MRRLNLALVVASCLFCGRAFSEADESSLDQARLAYENAKAVNPSFTLQDFLQKATHSARTNEIEFALKRGVDINSVAVLYEASQGNFALIKYLVGKGANPNARSDHYECTALHGLCWPNMPNNSYLGWVDLQTVEIVDYLVKAGADPDLKSTFRGDTPLLLALAHRMQSTALRLLYLGADPSIANDEGVTAMQLATQNGFSNIVAALRAARPSPR